MRPVSRRSDLLETMKVKRDGRTCRFARIRSRLLGSAAALLVAGAGFGATAQEAGSGVIVITPLTTVVEHPPSGYFQDPYPIPLLGVSGTPVQLFSGTTKSILVCPPEIDANCVAPVSVSLDQGTLTAQAAAAGATLTTSDNYNIYLDGSGHWQMAATFYVKNPTLPSKGAWTVIVHAHPSNQQLPTAWIADTLLVGSFAQPARANYDGKYFVDGSSLYLIYSKNLSSKPVHDGIVAQRMVSPTRKAAVGPVVLLEPAPGAGLNSELFFENDPDSEFKLVETGNITRIDGKYALAYSTGAFDEGDYKAGVAWSDTLLPKPGSFYRKVLRPDPTAIWGKPGPEVQYLLQSQEPAWPNDVASEVIAPGVPSIVQASDGSYRLYFAGYAPSDHPDEPGTPFVEATHRRPFFATLRVDIPPDATVAGATDTDLASWITPIAR